jgi:hypothetical protein
MSIGGASRVWRLAPTFFWSATRSLGADLLVEIPIEDKEEEGGMT